MPAKPDAGVGAAPAGAGADRVSWIFRDSLRNRQLHPLMEVVREYRRGGPK